MNRSRLMELVGNGEGTALEFERDGLRIEDLARDLVAFLNTAGGILLIGVEDDGSISGAARGNLEQRVTDACRNRIEPPVFPLLSWTREIGPGRDVLAVSVPPGPDEPYARLHNNRRTHYIRTGSTSREISQEELRQISQLWSSPHYGSRPVPGADLDALDRRRLRDYLTRVLEGDAPEDDDLGGWERLLHVFGFMTVSAGRYMATIDGLLLFGKLPSRYVPQSGIRAICYPGVEPDYATRADENLRGPMVALRSRDGTLVESGLADQAWDFVRRNTTPTARLEGPRRIDRWEYPEDVVREAVINALVHRDYSITGTDIMLALFADRMEIVSPGRLPNTVTIERMKMGVRYARNQTLVNIMRDYGYVDNRGMGIRNKILPGMRAHNGTVPDLADEEFRFTVRLWKTAKGQSPAGTVKPS